MRKNIPILLPSEMWKKCLINIVFILLLSSIVVLAQPVQLHPDNSHYFLFQAKPKVFVSSAEHYGAVLNLEFDYKKYLKALHEDKMTYTRIFTGAYVENDKSFGIERNTLAPLKNKVITPWARSNVPGYINGGNKFDLSKWNPDYFERLKDFVSTANEYGIIVELTFFSSIYNDGYWEYSPLFAENNINQTDRVERTYVNTLLNGNLWSFQEGMVRKIVKELNDYDNLIYEIQNEPWADQNGKLALLNNTVIPKEEQKWYTKTNQATDLSLAWQQKIAEAVRDEEKNLPKKHLIAQNYCNYWQALPEVKPEIDIINFHYVWPQAVEYNYGYQRPISFDESGFSGKEAATYRKQAWQFILAGGAVFNNLDYSFVAGHEDGSFVENKSPGFGSKAFRAQLAFLQQFMEQLDFVNMVPSKHLIQHAPGMVYYGLANEGKSYAYYFMGEKDAILVDLNVPKGNYKVEWWSPESGKLISEQFISSQKGLLSLKGPELKKDIALKVSRN